MNKKTDVKNQIKLDLFDLMMKDLPQSKLFCINLLHERLRGMLKDNESSHLLHAYTDELIKEIMLND